MERVAIGQQKLGLDVAVLCHVLCLLEYQVRCQLAQQQQVLAGLYSGHPTPFWQTLFQNERTIRVVKYPVYQVLDTYPRIRYT